MRSRRRPWLREAEPFAQRSRSRTIELGGLAGTIAVARAGASPLAVRHLGPMAQDFHAAFGVGEDDRHISSIDEDGVALAAAKSLASKNSALESRMRHIEAQDAKLQDEVNALLARR